MGMQWRPAHACMHGAACGSTPGLTRTMWGTRGPGSHPPRRTLAASAPAGTDRSVIAGREPAPASTCRSQPPQQPHPLLIKLRLAQGWRDRLHGLLVQAVHSVPHAVHDDLFVPRVGLLGMPLNYEQSQVSVEGIRAVLPALACSIALASAARALLSSGLAIALLCCCHHLRPCHGQGVQATIQAS